MKWLLVLWFSLLPATAFLQTQQTDHIKSEMDRIYAEIIDGKSFALMANLYSQDVGSAQQEGLYDWVNPNKLDKEFAKVLNSLEIGVVSSPFKTSYGYHIVQVVDRKEKKIMFRHILLLT